MLVKTEGIVFKAIKFGESSLILEIFTKEHGIQSFIINGVRKPNSKIPPSILAPMQHLQMVVYFNGTNPQLHRIKEAHSIIAFHGIHSNFIKTSIALFILECSKKTIRESGSQPEMFAFLVDTFDRLNSQNGMLTFFPLLFLVQWTKFLGIWPYGKWSEETPYFNLVKGTFQNSPDSHYAYLESLETKLLSMLMESNFSSLHLLEYPKESRKILLEKILDYYKIHIEGMKEVTSHKILESILHN
jgi:DNA repair protein RecO (recombination protein O)